MYVLYWRAPLYNYLLRGNIYVYRVEQQTRRRISSWSCTRFLVEIDIFFISHQTKHFFGNMCFFSGIRIGTFKDFLFTRIRNDNIRPWEIHTLLIQINHIFPTILNAFEHILHIRTTRTTIETCCTENSHDVVYQNLPDPSPRLCFFVC